MMTLDPNDSFFQEDDSHSRDDELKNAKDTQLYKATMALLKQKMCTAQDLLEQFNDKVKEYNKVNLELHESKLDREKFFNKYNSASEKIARLELSNRDHEKSRNDYKNTAEKQKLELDEKKKHIEQLEFKIKEMEKDSFRLKDEIKKLQQESKISKSMAKKATKSQASQTNCFQQQDASVNTDFTKTSPKKPQMRDKNVTDKVVNAGKEPFPLLCSKCEDPLNFPPVERILKIMSSPPPPSLSNPFSPPCSPRSIPSSSKQSIASNTWEQDVHENFESNSFGKRTMEKSRTNEESNGTSFMLIDKLTRKINNLEQQMKKNRQKRDKCCHQTCSTSKNIKFVVQLPNEERYFEYAKQHRRKRVKRLNKKQIKLKNKRSSKARGWQVENDVKNQNIQSSLQHGTDQSEQKYKNLMYANEIDLFESPAILVSNSTPNNQVGEDPCTTMQTPQMDSHSALHTNKANVKKNECKVQSSSTVLAHTSYHENIVREAKQSADCDSKKVFQTVCDQTVNLNSQNFDDVVSIAKESDGDNTKNVDPACKSIKSRDDGATVLKTNSKLTNQENDKEMESPKMRSVSISSAISSAIDELSSAVVTDEDLDTIRHEQNSIHEVDCVKETVEKVEARSSSSIESSEEKQINLEENISESMEDQSSDESLNFRCSAASSSKRGKFSNIIESDDSSEENLEKLNKNDCRKKLIAQRNKLISKIRNLRKTSKNPITSNGQPQEKRAEPRDDVPAYAPPKRQRVAHTPKDASQVKEVASAKDVSQTLQDSCEIQKAESKNITPKSSSRAKKAKSTKDLPRKTKKFKLMENVKSEQNGTEQSINVAKSEATLDESDSLETAAVTGECHEMEVETSCKENDQDKNEKREKHEMTDEDSKLDLLASQAIEKKTESAEYCSRTHDNNDHSNIDKGEDAPDDESLGDSKNDFCLVNEDQEEMPTRKLRCRNVIVERPARRISTRLKESIVPNSDTNVTPAPFDCKKSRKKRKSKANKLPFVEKFDSSNSSLPDTVILSHLNDFLLETNKEKKQENIEFLKNNEKPIREQLSLLMKSEPLAADVLSQVSENLLSTSQLNVVALVLVEYATTEYLDDIKCDRTYTPPAPPMTKFEQKLVTLIMSIKEKQPEFVDAVEKGLRYKLFRLGKPQEVQIVERLFRILVVLNKIKKDREKVRMLFCDALYCFNARAMNIIYVTLSCWSEVFPKHDSNNDILVKTIVHIIMSANVNRPFSKLMPLKRLLTDYYGYPNCGFRIETFKEELMNNLKENVPGINTAILLLCKSKGAEWTLENIIKGLKEMIVNQAHPSMYDALTLLGNLLRPFSSDNLKESLEGITDQLCDVLSGGTGLHDLEEGIVSCLLNIGGKFPFKREKIARHVLKWHSNQDLRPTTKEKFNSFLKTHNAGWWRKFVQQNFPPAE